MTKMEDDLLRDRVSRATKYLLEIGAIGSWRKPRAALCVSLNLQTIFNQLVSLYIPLFQWTWKQFSYIYEESALLPPWTYAARVYISAWIHDLYVSNRKAVQTLCSSAFLQHYLRKEVYCSLKYDDFLIRPTHIKGTPEDTVYVPILSDSPAWDTDNPFNIDNFVLNYDLASGIIANMKGCRMSTIGLNNLGRPSWLFDWHEDDKCCAWFPSEGNYTMQDVTVAYIIGAACTPNLGFRDTDDWQDRLVPENANPLDYDRVEGRHFYGSYEVRSIERRKIRRTVVYDGRNVKEMHILPLLVGETTQPPRPSERKEEDHRVHGCHFKCCNTDWEPVLRSHNQYHHNQPIPANRLDVLWPCYSAHGCP